MAVPSNVCWSLPVLLSVLSPVGDDSTLEPLLVAVTVLVIVANAAVTVMVGPVSVTVVVCVDIDDEVKVSVIVLVEMLGVTATNCCTNRHYIYLVRHPKGIFYVLNNLYIKVDHFQIIVTFERNCIMDMQIEVK